MRNVFEEEEVNNLVDKFTKDTVDKLKPNLLDDVYQTVSDYLYEHYQNIQDKIEAELIRSICETFVRNPMEYKFAELRKKIFNENKEELTSLLTEEGIDKSVDIVMNKYTSKDYYFEWKWKDNIAEFILDNWNKFKDDKRIESALLRKIENQENYINKLKNKLSEIGGIVE